MINEMDTITYGPLLRFCGFIENANVFHSVQFDELIFHGGIHCNIVWIQLFSVNQRKLIIPKSNSFTRLKREKNDSYAWMEKQAKVSFQ